MPVSPALYARFILTVIVSAGSFEGVTAVLFVAAISEYDQLLYEDDKTNRMVEALNLFEEICNSRWCGVRSHAKCVPCVLFAGSATRR
jgi:hypothetical protein